MHFVNKIRRDFIKRKVQVWINHNNETGVWQWSIQVAEGSESDREFWIDSFETKREAKAFIKEHGLREAGNGR